MRPASLTEILLGSTAASAPHADPAPAPGSLELLLQEILKSARAAWPMIDLAPELFVDYLRSRLRRDVPPVEVLASLHTSDLYLACACARGDARALAAFETHYLAHVDRALATLRVGPDMVAEVKQQLRRTLLVADQGPPKITEFRGSGDLRGWLRVMAVRDALDMLRRERREQTPDDDQLLDEGLGTQTNPELEMLKNMYRDEFKRAVGEAILGLTARERTILRQHFIDGLNIDEIGTVFRVHRATAARWLERARQNVLQATRAALMKRLAVQPAELDSLMRLIRSRLDMSVRVFFRHRGR
jgi:RNA polymerase sigma-70 factor (ECF subfamily)